MLRELRIKNFTIIDELSINFESGLNVLTGETGAGKSVVVDAIGLLLGDKASSEMIRTGSKEAHIEAYFDNTDCTALGELSIETGDGIIVRRNISSQGKGRSYINDTPVSLQTLAATGEGLIDIHGQHEHQGLLKNDNHLLFLDGFAGLTEDAASLQALYNEVISLRNKVNELKERVRERNQRIEFLRFQINEIDSANLKHGEKESIEEEMKILLNLSRLRESSETAYNLLYGSDGSCLEKIFNVSSLARDIARFDPEAKEILDAVEPIVPQMEDAALLLRKFKDKYETDPGKLEDLDGRLEVIKKLEKKYGEGTDEMLKYRDRAGEELKDLEHMDEQQELFEAEFRSKETELLSVAEELSGKRDAAAKRMEKMISGELYDLGFQKAVFRADIKKRETVTANGMDDVEFLFSANPGEPAKPLMKVASGGELSRIMLALKCIEIKEAIGDRLKAIGERTLVFDEVDAGVGGVTAQHVGKRLSALAKNYQVVCITHLPQIAALADNHLRVDKIIAKDSVKVSIETLADNKRQEELARMLSGTVTEVSLRHAKELLGI